MGTRFPLIVVMVCVCFLLAAALPSWAAPKESPKQPAAQAAPAPSSAGPSIQRDTIITVPPSKLKDTPLPSMISISSPGSGDTVLINESWEIKWASIGQVKNIVDIEAVEVGTNAKFGIIGQTLNDGSFSWPVLGLKPGKYMIRITDKKVTGESIPFDVAKPAVDLASPAQGASWYVGETHNITWRPGMLPDGAKLRIDFVRPDGTTFNIGSSLANSGKFTWTVIKDALTKTMYNKPGSSISTPVWSDTTGTLRVTAVAAGWPYTAERQLLLALPSITVTSPKGGDTWYVGKTYTVNWIKKGPMDSMVQVGLWSAGSYINLPLTTANVSNTGTTTITVPPSKFLDDNPNWSSFKVQVYTMVGDIGETVYLHVKK